MRRLSLLVLPFLAAFAMVFGLYYLYTAIRLFSDGYKMQAALWGVFGLMGLGLAVGIWIARKRAGRAGAPGAPNAPGKGPSA